VGKSIDIQHSKFENNNNNIQQQESGSKYKSTAIQQNQIESGSSENNKNCSVGVCAKNESDERQASTSFFFNNTNKINVHQASTSSIFNINNNNNEQSNSKNFKILFNQFTKTKNTKQQQQTNNTSTSFSSKSKSWYDFERLANVAPFQSKLPFNLANPAQSVEKLSPKQKSNYFAQARQTTKYLNAATELVKIQLSCYDQNLEYQPPSDYEFGNFQQQQQQQQQFSDCSTNLPSYAEFQAAVGSGDGETRRSNQANLGRVNMVGTWSPSQTVPQLLHRVSSAVGDGNGFSNGSVSRVDGSPQGVNASDLRQGSQSLLQSDRDALNSNSQSLLLGVKHQLQRGGHQTSDSNLQSSTGASLLSHVQNAATPTVGVAGVENCVTLGRHRDADKRQLRVAAQSPRTRNSDSLEESSQKHKSETIQRNRDDGGEGEQQRSQVSPTSRISTGNVATEPKALPILNGSNGQISQATQQIEIDHGSQLQARSDSAPHGSGAGQPGLRSRSDPLVGETQKQTHADHRQLHSLQLRQGSSRQSSWHTKSNSALVENNKNNNLSVKNNYIRGGKNNNNNNNNQYSSSSSSFTKFIKKQYDDMNFSLFRGEKLNNNNQNNNSFVQGKASFTRHAHNSKLPTREEQETVPLHSSDVSNQILDINKIKSLMSDKYSSRLQYLLDLIFVQYPKHVEQATTNNNNNNPFADISSFKKQEYPVKDAKKLVADGVASEVSDKTTTKSFGIPFNVIEEKDGKSRRRFIFWTKDMNEFLEAANYQPQLKNLKFQNYYLESALGSMAVTGDLKISFFQVEIPKQIRQYFRFVDADGNLYELNRLPMGLKVSPEIMQLIVECIAGLPEACKESASIEGVTTELQEQNGDVNVWIDGFAISYTSRRFAEAAQFRIRKVGRYCNVTFKDPGVVIEQQYDFIGIHFDHKSHSVRVADKTLQKLPPPSFVPKQQIKISELERLISRLIFCSGVTRDILGKYFFLLKWSNRQIAKLNATGVDSDVQLPQTCTNLLNSWIKASSQTLQINSRKSFNYDILFVDASTYGWGAYFISSSGVVAIVGERWSEEILQDANYNINVLEAYAVELALRAFEDRLSENCNVDIRVDNTSSLFGILKSKSKSENPAHNKHIVNVVQFLTSRNFEYTLQYVNTSENWADGPSRGKGDVVCPSVEQITAVLYSNRGTHGRQAATSSVSGKTKSND
jgi:hypothetical protein